ncbi:MAG: M13 family metallopeptidase [Gemmatimonas sp.]
MIASRLARRLSAFVLSIASVSHAQGPRAPAVDPRDTIVSFAVGGWGFALGDRDLSVRPGDDFVQYAVGRWVTEATGAGVDRNNSYWRDLMRLSPRRVADVLRELGENRSLSPNTPEGKAGAFYRSFMDSAGIQRKGLTPLQPALSAIRNTKTYTDLARVMGAEAGSWTPRPASVTVQTFPLALFTIRIDQNPRNTARAAVFVGAAGQLLPAPTDYSDPKQEDIRRAYIEYTTGLLRLAKWDQPEKRARDILALETRVAAASWTLAQSRDAAAQVNPMTMADLRLFAPDFPWSAFLSGAGLASVRDVIVDTKSAFPALAKIFAETPIEVWQARQTVAILDQDAPKLSDDAATLAFEFRVKKFQGTAASQPRFFRVMLSADASIPEIVGALYTKRYYPPSVRAAADEMARQIRHAFDTRLMNSPYLSAASKTRARAKLADMRLDIGAPATTHDYRGLVFSDTDYFGNLRRARDYEWKRQVASLVQPLARPGWLFQPYNANYAYVPIWNAMEVTAGALEPPFFDMNADAAVNYGAIGTLIGAQMAAAFDHNGRRFGPKGALMDLFTADESKRIDGLRDSLSARLSTLEAFPGLRLQGPLIVDEDMNDIIGIQVALDAYHNVLNGTVAPVRDGTTGDQRFFLGRAQMWRAVFVPSFLRGLVANGRNTPPPLRIAVTAQHVDAWYDAFAVTPDRRLYIEPGKRPHFLF